MFYRRWFRALALTLFGMGVFFLIGSLLALVVWLSVGYWRQFLAEVALVAMLVTIPVAYYVWNYSIVHRL